MRVAFLLLPLLRPTSLVRVSVLAVGAAIASNALFLQGGRHPDPLFATREVQTPVMPAPEIADASPAALATPAPDDLVFAIQDALREAGLYDGPIDGMSGPKTQAAIIAFEHGAGRTPSGEATFELLGELTAAIDAPDEGDAAAPPAPPVDPDPRLQAVQAALSRAAYGPLPADGIFGPQTRDAIARFQGDHNLPVTGEFSEALLVELAAIGALEGE